MCTARAFRFRAGRACAAYIGVIVFRKDIKESAVNSRFRIVELGNVRVLDPIDQHFAPQHQQKGSDDLFRPVGEHCEAFR